MKGVPPKPPVVPHFRCISPHTPKLRLSSNVTLPVHIVEMKAFRNIVFKGRPEPDAIFRPW
jgi:hypothetical protein